MTMFYILLVTLLLWAMAGGYFVYRVYMPKMEQRLRKSLEDTIDVYRLETIHEWEHYKTETMKVLIDAVEKHTKAVGAETKSAVFEYANAEVAKLRRDLQEQVDALTQDTAEAIDGKLNDRITNIVLEALIAQTPPKLDGVTADGPGEEEPEKKRFVSNSWNW